MHKVFGIRHHGPGSARSLRRSLGTFQPDIVLVEGPPEADDLVQFVQNPGLKPPVALLVYREDSLDQVSYYPFATFSPEWQAMCMSLELEVPFRFIDLSIAHSWGGDKENSREGHVSLDPLSHIAQAAGMENGESWWESRVEMEGEADIFEEIRELMGSMRRQPHFLKHETTETLRREAFMRQHIRKAEKEGFRRIAVVCGAYHADALALLPTAAFDKKILKGMKTSRKVRATWIPWTYGRLSVQSGYGAGVISPAWYEQLFEVAPEIRDIHWMGRAAHLFRKQEIDISPGHVVEGVRLAHALAQLRARSAPGLPELWDAVETVFCQGDALPMKLVEKELVIGDKMGTVPEEVPAFPLQHDFRKQKKSLRLKDTGDKPAALDLRKPLHLKKSRFLHRLNLLQITWGQLLPSQGDGTFHEQWKLYWGPDEELALIFAAAWGNTVEEAAYRWIHEKLRSKPELPELTDLLGKVLLASLPEALEKLLRQLRHKVAKGSDMGLLMEAVPPLVESLRYSNVRMTNKQSIELVLDELLPRLFIGLPAACCGLDETHEEHRLEQIKQVNHGIQLMEDAARQASWWRCLQQIGTHLQTAPRIAGAAVRLLFEKGVWNASKTEQVFAAALSPAVSVGEASRWLGGFLDGPGLLLVYHPGLVRLMDQWMMELSEEQFIQALPLLRRSFSHFSQAEKRELTHHALNPTQQEKNTDAPSLNHDRVQRVMPILRQILTPDPHES
ncbi:MAG: DUF5682 family protein [Bacteroidota bacterium]